MKTTIINILAVVVGLVVGAFVNMGIITISPSIIPLPAGIDPMDPESIAANMHLFEPRNYVMPFLAHALGTVVGATIAWLIAASNKDWMAYIVGAGFFAGGIMAARMLPGPMWFEAFDIIVAYFPMAWLGIQLAKMIKKD